MASAAPDATSVRVLFLDVDGTMTDGVIGFSKDGDFRNFWVRDGIALEWARDLGVRPVIISGRASLAVEARMHDLRLEFYLGAKDKVSIAETVMAREGVTWKDCAMVGDSLHDLQAARAAGMRAVAVLTGLTGRAELAPEADVVLDTIAELPDWVLAQG